MYLENRQALLAQLNPLINDLLSESRAGGGADEKSLPKTVHFLLASAQRPVRTGSDSEYPFFRQTSALMYILGEFEISPSLVVLSVNVQAGRAKRGSQSLSFQNVSAGGLAITIFLPVRPNREYVFTGPDPAPHVLQKEFQVQFVKSMSEFTDSFEKGTTLWTLSPWADIEAALDLSSLSSLSPHCKKRQSYGEGQSYGERQGDPSIKCIMSKDKKEDHLSIIFSPALDEAFNRARFIKSDKELALLRYSSHVAVWAHSELESLIHQGSEGLTGIF